MNTYETTGTYGSNLTPCDVLVYEGLHGLQWYCVLGSVNVNATYDPIKSGVDVETLSDVDCFTSGEAIESIGELETAMES